MIGPMNVNGAIKRVGQANISRLISRVGEFQHDVEMGNHIAGNGAGEADERWNQPGDCWMNSSAKDAASTMQKRLISPELRLCPQRSPSQPKSSRITACVPMKDRIQQADVGAAQVVVDIAEYYEEADSHHTQAQQGHSR